MLRFSALVEVDGKPDPREWTDKDGNKKMSYKLNISQNDGRDIATISCDEKTYSSVKRRDTVMAHFAYSDGGGNLNSRPYLKLEGMESAHADNSVFGSVRPGASVSSGNQPSVK